MAATGLLQQRTLDIIANNALGEKFNLTYNFKLLLNYNKEKKHFINAALNYRYLLF
jgi:hypothetical protein